MHVLVSLDFVAQFGRAKAYEAFGRRFNSCRIIEKRKVIADGKLKCPNSRHGFYEPGGRKLARWTALITKRTVGFSDPL